jgi:GNAT superfamily N-acetyltransferase
MSISFAQATLADIPLIRTLADRIWQKHYPDIISMAQIDYMLGKMYSAASITAQMQGGQNYTLVYADGMAVGYYAVSENTIGHYFLHKFYIDTELHRKGIGTGAFAYLIANDCKGYTEIRLQVNRRNVKAINFYFKHGFAIDCAQDFDFGSGYTMDDFVMVRKSTYLSA